jgi:hypothetical protein
MADLLFTTKTHKVLGTLSNGVKIVASTFTTADTGDAATVFTITPLKRIIAFFPTFKTNVTNVPTTVFSAGTLPNQITIDPPAGNIDTAIVEIISFGV